MHRSRTQMCVVLLCVHHCIKTTIWAWYCICMHAALTVLALVVQAIVQICTHSAVQPARFHNCVPSSWLQGPSQQHNCKRKDQQSSARLVRRQVCRVDAEPGVAISKEDRCSSACQPGMWGVLTMQHIIFSGAWLLSWLLSWHITYAQHDKWQIAAPFVHQLVLCTASCRVYSQHSVCIMRSLYYKVCAEAYHVLCTITG